MDEKYIQQNGKTDGKDRSTKAFLTILLSRIKFHTEKTTIDVSVILSCVLFNIAAVALAMT
uniref:Uncharacterized protein n=1 Tax=Romanomermis culicivorax TaxID=13658 RepID=A0A915KRV6_ROMCU